MSDIKGVYQRGGWKAVVVAAKQKVWGGTEVPYQQKLAGSLESRVAMIQEALPEDAKTVLDVGCNLGDIGARLARSGRWVVGVDNSAMLISEAHNKHGPLPDCAFMCMEIGPNNVTQLPNFDAVLLLSVHHHWLMAHGPEVAGWMLRALADKTDKVLIFEGSSRRVRYGDFPPDFIDNDEATVTAYLEGYLRQFVGDAFNRIVPLGKTECVGEREPFRWSFALYK